MPIPRSIKIAGCCAALAFATHPLRASETLGTVPDSAAALGMVGGHLANFTDISAIHYSPANLTEVTRPEAELNYSAWYGDIRFRQERSGETVKMLDPWKMLGSFYYAHPIVPGKVTLGVGVTTPFGLDSQWPKNGPIKYLIPYEAQLITLDINPVIAFQPVENVSIGVGLDVMYSSLELRQLYPWSQAIPGLPLPDGETHFKADGWGVGAFMGITWKITPRQRLTVVGRLPLEIEYDGDFNVTNLPGFVADAQGVRSHSGFKSKIKYPGSVAVGYGLDVTDRLTLGLDFLWAANSSHHDVPLDIGRNQPLLGTSGLVVDWKDSIDIGIGAQYRLDDHWILRSGYLYSQASQRDAHYTPSVPSNDRHLMSVGLGYRTARHSLDLAYAYALFPDRRVSGDTQPAFDGKYEIGWHVLSASYSFRF